MKVLHISSDYPNTSLYKELLMHYSPESGYQHVMYVPVAVGADVSRKYDYEAPNARVLYSPDFTQLDRFLYNRKRLRINAAIRRQVPLHDVQLVHAHYLFSAGGVAYELKRTQGIDYIVAIRNTDLNFFFKYALHLRRFGLRILQEASAIVFLSPAYQDALLEQYVPEPLRQSLRAKSVVLPNGISDFWLENLHHREPWPQGRKEIHLAYVGGFTRNKNIETSLRVVGELKQRGFNPRITLVGDGPHASGIRELVANLGPLATIRSWTESKEELLDVYRSADLFIMPSLAETFGLVYAEAMSQGLPLIYTRGQGIDGYFPDGTVGYACNPLDVRQIADRVQQIVENYDGVANACTESTIIFSWSRIAAEYEDLYRSVCQNKESSE